MMKRTVLIVEPHDGLRDNIKELLELEGYDVEILPSSPASEEITRVDNPTILLVNTTQLPQKILNQVSTAQHTPIVILSPRPDGIAKFPLCTWLPLPFETHELLVAVKKAFNTELKIIDS